MLYPQQLNKEETMSAASNENWQRLFKNLGLPVGLSAAALGTMYFLRKFGIIYQLFHKVCNKSFLIKLYTLIYIQVLFLFQNSDQSKTIADRRAYNDVVLYQRRSVFTNVSHTEYRRAYNHIMHSSPLPLTIRLNHADHTNNNSFFIVQ